MSNEEVELEGIKTALYDIAETLNAMYRLQLATMLILVVSIIALILLYTPFLGVV